MQPGAPLSRISLRSAVDVASSLAMLVAACLIVYTLFASRPPQTTQAPAPVPVDPVPIAGAAVLGRSDAEVGMLIFSDFQCPYCKRFALDTLQQVRRSYVDNGEVLIAFDHLPLTDVHPRAMRAAAAAECGRRQDAFWPMHDQIFAATQGLEDSALRSYAGAAGLNISQFTSCFTAAPSEEIQKSMELAGKLGIAVTPTILVGSLKRGTLEVTAVVRGAQPFTEFKKVIDPLLKR